MSAAHKTPSQKERSPSISPPGRWPSAAAPAKNPAHRGLETPVRGILTPLKPSSLAQTPKKRSRGVSFAEKTANTYEVMCIKPGNAAKSEQVITTAPIVHYSPVLARKLAQARDDPFTQFATIEADPEIFRLFCSWSKTGSTPALGYWGSERKIPLSHDPLEEARKHDPFVYAIEDLTEEELAATGQLSYCKMIDLWVLGTELQCEKLKRYLVECAIQKSYTWQPKGSDLHHMFRVTNGKDGLRMLLEDIFIIRINKPPACSKTWPQAFRHAVVDGLNEKASGTPMEFRATEKYLKGR